MLIRVDNKVSLLKNFSTVFAKLPVTSRLPLSDILEWFLIKNIFVEPFWKHNKTQEAAFLEAKKQFIKTRRNT